MITYFSFDFCHVSSYLWMLYLLNPLNIILTLWTASLSFTSAMNKQLSHPTSADLLLLMSSRHFLYFLLIISTYSEIKFLLLLSYLRNSKNLTAFYRFYLRYYLFLVRARHCSIPPISYLCIQVWTRILIVGRLSTFIFIYYSQFLSDLILT